MAPTTKLQLCLSASNLPRTSKKLASPYVRAKVWRVGSGPPDLMVAQTATDAGPTHIGTTEVIKSCHPRWCKIFYLTYEFGSVCNFCVDLVQEKNEESRSKSIGVAHFEVGDILGSRNKTKVKRLRKGGCIFATIEQSTDEGSGGRVFFQLSAPRLDCKQGMLSRSEPSTFFEIARQTNTPAGNKFVAVYRSQPVLESCRPCWDRAEMDMASFCNGDADRPLKVSVFVHKKRGNHVLLGSFETTLNVMIANGDPRVPGSLHYREEEGLNDYEETIVSVGKAIARYSARQEFSVWGFGAKYSGIVRHIFQLGADATAKGIDGVLDAYKSVFLTDLTMSGPTDITSVVKAAASRAKKFEHGSLRYGVLLVLTDGIVSDADTTKALLHAISDLPLTVLIVGIGAADFTCMNEIVEYSNSTSRHNVSFVSYREHQDDPRALSTAGLRDIPNHIVDYFDGKGISPTNA